MMNEPPTLFSDDPQPRLPESPASMLLNRELSWLAFNRRVLDEAHQPRHPLLERTKFAAIVSSNLDEFFIVRVASLKQQVRSGVTQRSPDGQTAAEQLPQLYAAILALLRDQHQLVVSQLLPELAAAGIAVTTYSALTPQERQALDTYFFETIFPILTPLALDLRQPFPHISSLNLNLLFVLEDDAGTECLARVKIPEPLPRLLRLSTIVGPTPGGEERLLWIEDLIEANARSLFSGVQILHTYAFRVLRDADIALQEEEAADLLQMMRQHLHRRQFSSVVCMQVASAMPGALVGLLAERLGIEQGGQDIYRLDGPLDLRGIRELAKINRPDLKDAPFTPTIPPSIDREATIFDAIRQGDILLHHPYDSFEVVEDFLWAAADDPNVLTIKQTLYRLGPNSPIIEALMKARERGKQVAVLVELKARFAVVFPILDAAIRRTLLDDVLGAALRDTENARELQPDGSFAHCSAAGTSQPAFDSPTWLLARAYQGE